ncbi:MAG: hypothetical protein ACRELS_13865 [Candidatus Rokuibacteriota bacterium]
MRPLLRWISLVTTVVVLGVLGAARTHQQNFTLFLTAVLGLSALVLIVFVATAARDHPK